MDSISSSVMLELVKSELQAIGFTSVEEQPLTELSSILLLFYDSLLQQIKSLVTNANRTTINIKDVLIAIEELQFTNVESLIEHVHSTPPTDTATLSRLPPKQIPLEPSGLIHFPDFTTPAYLIDSFLPALPPSHSYKTTPVYPISQSSAQNDAILLPNPTAVLQPPPQFALKHISTIRSRLLNSKKVSESLRNLINSTNSALNHSGSTVVEGKNLVGLEEVINFEGIWYKSGVGGNAGVKRKWKV